MISRRATIEDGRTDQPASVEQGEDVHVDPTTLVPRDCDAASADNIFGSQYWLTSTGWPLRQQLIVSTALNMAFLLVVLVVNWLITRPLAKPAAPSYWPDRPFQAGVLVFLIPGFSRLDELVDKATDKTLHLSVSAFLFALSLFLGCLTYRLLIQPDARDAARNAMVKGQS